MIEKISEKIDKYNLFTNIIPGFLLLIFNMYYFEIGRLGVMEELIISYFVGLTLSRIGSIFVAEILFKLTAEKGESYKEYINACEKDKKIDTLLQTRNTYRTICAMLLVAFLEIITSKVLKLISIPNDIMILIIISLLIIIYAISFCKNNKYIAERVRNIKCEKETK